MDAAQLSYSIHGGYPVQTCNEVQPLRQTLQARKILGVGMLFQSTITAYLLGLINSEMPMFIFL